MMIDVIINGKKIKAEEGLTILQVAIKSGITIPTLCYHPVLEAQGACRLCTVKIVQGKRDRFVTSCNFPITDGLEVFTETGDVMMARKTIIELLLARCPDVEILRGLAEKYGIKEPRFKIGNDRCILCGLCVRVCEERIGRSAITMIDRGMDMKVGTPFKIHADACIACGACISVCPTDAIKIEDITGRRPMPIPSEFNEGLNSRHPIYLPYPQAVPNTPAIDRNYCVYLNSGQCKMCQDVCEAGAIDYTQVDEVVEIEVGSIILAPGFDTFDPKMKSEFGYGNIQNVITSLEFERILSASGPFSGEIMRPSDKKHPRKVAWIQCVGSRDISCNRDYCSSVCCMYATKEAVIAKEHDGNIEPTIFFMDIRAFGKGFDTYYERAISQYGVRYVRSMVSGLYERPANRNVIVAYINEEGKKTEEEFDMVVLSVGIGPSKKGIDLCGRLGIELNRHNFCKTTTFEPLTTSREGIFLSGSFQTPKDIPETVTQGSGAAAYAGSIISSARGELIEEQSYPDEKDTSAEEVRIGVFVCHCGINIAGVVDVKAVRDYAKTLPGVAYADNCLYTCSQDNQKKMIGLIEEHNLNRVVTAACSPRTHEPLFRETIREAGLNKYLYEMANIRDQCSWVHMNEKGKATEKAKDLVRMAVANARLLAPLQEITLEVNHSALVIGGGNAGMTAALKLGDMGYDVTLIEKESELGGNLRHVFYTIHGDDVQAYLEDLIRKTESHPRVTVIKNAEIDNVEGYKGNFTTSLIVGAGLRSVKIEHGIAIVATGADEARPAEYLYGENSSVLTQMELEKMIMGDVTAVKAMKEIVMIQCVGSRNEERPYCSRICCSHAVKNALKLKEINPAMKIYVLYRDIRTYGLYEEYYTKAREKGVIFIRYDLSEKPVVSMKDGRLTVSAADPVLKTRFDFRPDLLILSSAVIPKENEIMAGLLKINRSEDNFYLEAHMKLRPVDFSTEGVFVAGMAHLPKLIEETISQSAAAAARAAIILSKDKLVAESVIARVNPELCAVCLTCVRACPFGVPVINEESTAEINPVLCQGCGTCVSECPGKAIVLQHYRDEQILAKSKNSIGVN